MSHPLSDSSSNRFLLACNFINDLIDSAYRINKNIEIGLFCFGHTKNIRDSNCYDYNLEVAFSKDVRTQVRLRLEDLYPGGYSPLTNSVLFVGETQIVKEERYNYELVLVTDGGESCNRNFCEAYEKIKQKKSVFNTNIVFVNMPNATHSFKCEDSEYHINSQNKYNVINSILGKYKSKSTSFSSNGYGQLTINGISEEGTINLFVKINNSYIKLNNMRIDTSNQTQSISLLVGQYLIKVNYKKEMLEKIIDIKPNIETIVKL